MRTSHVGIINQNYSQALMYYYIIVIVEAICLVARLNYLILNTQYCVTMCGCKSLCVTGFWKTNRNVALGLLHFITQPIATLIHYSCTVALPGLADWSAFLERVLPTM